MKTTPLPIGDAALAQFHIGLLTLFIEETEMEVIGAALGGLAGHIL